MGACSGGPSQYRVVYATRADAGPAGANVSERVSMYQIASASLRATSTRHLGAALTAEAALGGLVVRGAGDVAGGMHGGLDQGPAQVLGAVLGERPAAVGGARLVGPGAEAGVTDQLLGRREAPDLADLRGDRVGQYIRRCRAPS